MLEISVHNDANRVVLLAVSDDHLHRISVTMSADEAEELSSRLRSTADMIKKNFPWRCKARHPNVVDLVKQTLANTTGWSVFK
jgi:hypothetical protein